jgi:hypothetical protein
MLGGITRGPVFGSLKNQKVENTIVNRRASFGLLPKVQTSEALCELRDESRRGGVVVEPSLDVEEIAGAC